MTIAADNPIESSSQDLMSRGPVVTSLANNIRSVDASHGYVLAVLGPWGSGKTSLVNLVREALQTEHALPVLDFNPWMFSGAEQLIDAFFGELAAQLRLKGPRFDDVSDTIDRYSRLLSPLAALPFVGGWIDRTQGAVKEATEFIQSKRPSVLELRDELTKQLAGLAAPIVVVIDDIDRLTTAEIREIFKLVRLTASFPNIVYLLCFDRVRVEQALTDDGVPGRDYLEKIVQTAFDLPRLPDALLQRTFLEAVDASIAATGANTRFDENVWPDLLMEIIWPLVSTMRDVRRYCASIFGTVSELQDSIELGDVLALEAIRIFLPNSFESIRNAQEALTATRDALLGDRAAEDDLKRRVEALLSSGDDAARQVLTALINRVFPAAQRLIGGSSYGSNWKSTWLKRRRLAHSDFLKLYLERVAGGAVNPFMQAEHLYAAMQAGEGFAERLARVPASELEDVIASLEVWDHEYPIDSIETAIIALLNKVSFIDDRPRGMFGVRDASMVVTRVVLRMLRMFSDPAQIVDLVTRILPQVNYFADKLTLIHLLGHHQNKEYDLIDDDAATQLEAAWALEVAAAGQAGIEREQRNTVRTVQDMVRFGQPMMSIDPTPTLTRRLLTDARSEAHGGVLGNRAVSRTYHLWWDALVDIAGSEAELSTAIDRMVSDAGYDSDEMEETVAVARRYLTGWRPDL